MPSPLHYAAITPARNEAANLVRLAAALAAQTQLPAVWVIVDNGSTDETRAVAGRLARDHAWVRVLAIPAGRQTRGGPIVRAFHAGLAELESSPDVVVKIDADVSMPPDHFEKLLAAFAADPRLGIASGTCFEREGGDWRERHMTGTTVWGCCRAYRAACLEQLLPLDEHMGWDGIDALKAELRGWRSGRELDLTFFHHRPEGDRDGARGSAYAAQGRAAHYLGYRPSYLVLRALHRARAEPAALAMIGGYAAAAVRRMPRCADPEVIAHLRAEPRVRLLRARIREAAGGRPAAPTSDDARGRPAAG
jgi:biofilm PGA synthesis N-glycosyltransferase PgaC